MLQFIVFILAIVALLIWAYRLDARRSSKASNLKRIGLVTFGFFSIVAFYALVSIYPVYVVTIQNDIGRDVHLNSRVIADSSIDSNFWWQSALLHKNETWTLPRYRFCYRWTCKTSPYPFDLSVSTENSQWVYQFFLPPEDTPHNPCSDFFVCRVHLKINEFGKIYLATDNMAVFDHQPNGYPVSPK